MTDIKGPPQAAVDNGHDLEWDPPFMGNGQRWTCARCGRAAIRVGTNEYGMAVLGRCLKDKEEVVDR